jgi:hypothetical protein
MCCDRAVALQSHIQVERNPIQGEFQCFAALSQHHSAPMQWPIELPFRCFYCSGVAFPLPCMKACISCGVRTPSLLASIALKTRS